VNDFLGSEQAGPRRSAALRSRFAAMGAFPIRKDGVVCGVLAVYAGDRDFFGDHEVDLLEEAAGDVSFALEHQDLAFRREEAEAALRQQKAEFETIFNLIPSGICYKDTHHRYIRVNDAACGHLGLTREQVKERLDSIVEFSALGEHVHSPTRTFSSGMLARLGFSIAVHVDADILIVDEVLAVGDYEFEKKCYAKIDEFRANGGTILFVSHNTGAVRRIADRCVWLHKGMVRMIGTPEEVIPLYESTPMDTDKPI